MRIRFPRLHVIFGSILASSARFGGAVAALALTACDPSVETKLLDQLFDPTSVTLPSLGATTYVIWINGDGDHFVPEVSVAAPAAGAPLASVSSTRRADAIESERIQTAAKRCDDCNVLLLHVQRMGAKWYTADSPFATYFRVYVRGQLTLERKVPILNAANPQLIARLLGFTDQFFANTSRNLIYRGHGFIPAYDPARAKSSLIAPFAYSHPESAFGPDEFTRGLEQARLKAPLDSVTFAACSMADLSLVAALAPYTRQVLAPEVDILETMSVSFGYDFIDRTRSGEAGEWIASQLMNRFRETQVTSESMMEFSLSVIDPAQAARLQAGMVLLAEQLRTESPNRTAMDQAAHVSKQLSDIYVDKLKRDGKTAASIQAMTTFIQSPSMEPGRVDIGLTLDYLAKQPLRSTTLQEIGELRAELGATVRVLQRPAVSSKAGLSVSLDAWLR